MCDTIYFDLLHFVVPCHRNSWRQSCADGGEYVEEDLFYIKVNSEGIESGDTHVVCCGDAEGHCES